MGSPAFVIEDVALRRGRTNYRSQPRPNSVPGFALWPGVTQYIPRKDCGGVLVLTDTDPNNCGDCGIVCGPGFTCCAGKPVPLQANCGACGNVCGPNQLCVQDEDGDRICADILTDPDHCGLSNQICPYINRDLDRCCDTGACVMNETALQTSSTSCGSCGNNCLDPNLFPPDPTSNPPNWWCSSGHCCPPCHVWFPGIRGSDSLWSDLLVIGGAFFGGALGAGLGSLAGDWASGLVAAGCRSCDELRDHPGGNWTCCNGRCFDLDTSVQNCGSCGNGCGSLQNCVHGKCVCNTTKFPQTCPPFNCADFATGLDQFGNTLFCGSCKGPWDPKTQCCVNGALETILPDSDPNNCGGCSTTQFGKKCPPDSACCGGKCIPLGTMQNCSACGDACAPGQSCCDFNCTGMKFDNDNCGSCGHSCELSGGVSAAGTWQADCCNGKCVDKNTDPAHCGVCGKPCDYPNICAGGACVSPVL